VDRFGYGGVVMLILLYLLWFEGRKLIREQTELSKAARVHLYKDAEHKELMAHALSQIAAATIERGDPLGSRKYARHVFSTVYTNRAIARLGTAIKEGFGVLCKDAGEAVETHEEAIKALLNDDADEQGPNGVKKS